MMEYSTLNQFLDGVMKKLLKNYSLKISLRIIGVKRIIFHLFVFLILI
nr:MAG TPA: hypothetical protein [Caudoviricetes sp.]